jgi:hypothetical protein
MPSDEGGALAVRRNKSGLCVGITMTRQQYGTLYIQTYEQHFRGTPAIFPDSKGDV